VLENICTQFGHMAVSEESKVPVTGSQQAALSLVSTSTLTVPLAASLILWIQTTSVWE